MDILLRVHRPLPSPKFPFSRYHRFRIVLMKILLQDFYLTAFSSCEITRLFSDSRSREKKKMVEERGQGKIKTRIPKRRAITAESSLIVFANSHVIEFSRDWTGTGTSGNPLSLKPRTFPPPCLHLPSHPSLKQDEMVSVEKPEPEVNSRVCAPRINFLLTTCITGNSPGEIGIYFAP